MANLANLLVRGVSRLGNVFASTVKADRLIGTVTKTEFIRGTQTAATGTWLGVTEDEQLYDGKEILYFLPYAGSGNATLNLTLSTGATTGAKNCYFSGTTRLTTHYGANSLIRMTYHTAFNVGGTNYEGWWSEPGRDRDSHYTTHLYAGSGTAANAATTNGNTKITVADNSTARESVTLKGAGATSVASDAAGVVTITSTDSHYTSKLITGGSATATANAAVTNNSVFLNLLDDSTVRNSHNIVGSGSVTVNSDANGKITINGTDNNTTYGLSISDHTVSLVAGGTTSSVTVPDNNDNNAVTQTISSTTNANYRVLLSATADDTTRTEGARKDKDFYYNPSTNTLTVGTVSGTATKATGDGSGNNIVNTYLTKAAGVTNVAWDNTNKKVTKTINGSTTDVVKVININTTVSVPSSGWTNSSGVYSQTVNVTGITATMEVEPVLGLYHASGTTQDAWTSQVEAWGAFAGTGWATTGAGTITLSCYDQPTADFTLSVQARYFST